MTFAAEKVFPIETSLDEIAIDDDSAWNNLFPLHYLPVLTD